MADNQELESLRGHNAELLSELKAAKADARRVTAELEAARDALAGAESELRALRLDGPVQEMVARVAMPGCAGAVAALIDASGFGFALDDEGKPAIIRKDGEPVTIRVKDGDGKRKPAEFTEADLTALLCDEGEHAPGFMPLIVGTRASGGGAGGARTGGGAPVASPERKAAAEAPQFGLK